MIIVSVSIINLALNNNLSGGKTNIFTSCNYLYILDTVFSLISALCAYCFQNSIPSFENSVDSDQLASDEAS